MNQRTRTLAAILVAALCSCAADQVSVDVRTSPEGARLYVNGEAQGISNRRVTFDFSAAERNLLQVVHPERPVVEEYYTREQLPEDDKPIFVKIPK